MMKKLICLTLAICLLLPVLPVVTFADDGVEFSYNTDFTGYTSSEDGIGPDSYWGDSGAGGNKPKFRSYIESGGNTCMELSALSEPTLWFGQMFTSGRMHISAYVKNMGSNLCIMVHGSESPGDNNIVNSRYEVNSSKYIELSADGKVVYYAPPISSWTQVDTGVTFNTNEWVRIDILTSDLSGATITADYYVNEELVVSQVDITETKSMKGVFFKHKTNGGANAYIDNVSVERFFGEKNLGCTSSDKIVPVENGEINVRLSESVDPALLIPENITIKNEITEDIVESFSLTNVSETGFKVNIEETLEYGRRYSLMISDVVRGKLTNAVVKKPLSFLSENKKAESGETVAELDFDSYDPADGDTAPSGFVEFEGSDDDSPCAQVVGKSGETDDFAWGIVNAKRNAMTKFLYETAEVLPNGAEYEVSFDIYSDNLRWFLFLAEPGDFDTSNTGYEKNMAIGTKTKNGEIVYASGRSDGKSGTTQVDTLEAEPEMWNSVKLVVKPIANGTTYTISINNAAEQTVSTSREFANGVAGLGFGCVPAGNSSEIRIDNVLLKWSMNIEYPEVKEVTVFDIYGAAVSTEQKVTSMISSMYVDFTANVAFDSAKTKCTMLENGMPITLEFEEDSENKSRIKVSFPELLNANSDYEFTVSQGVESSLSSDVGSEMSFDISFKTRNDASFKLLEVSYDDDLDSYKYVFAKNNEESAKLFAAAGVYETVTRTIDGVTDTFEEMQDFDYCPINVSETQKGIFEEYVSMTGDINKARVYLCKWPELIEVSTDANGNIQL